MVVGYILASETNLIEDSVHAEFIIQFKPLYRACPENVVPVILQESPSNILPVKWGLSQKQFQEKKEYFTRTYGIIKKPFHRILIRKSRCLIPTNGLIIRLKGRLYFLFSKKEKILTISGIYHTWKIKNSQKTTSGFSILTQPAPRNLSGLCTDIPVIISGGGRRRFLKKQKPMMDILPMLSNPFGNLFRIYELRNDLLQLESPTRKDILPIADKIHSSGESLKIINTKKYYY